MANKPNNQGQRTPQPPARPTYDPPTEPRRGGRERQGLAETAIKAFIRSIAGSIGRAITRALVGRR